MMSKVERKLQLKVRGELEKMGLINGRDENMNTGVGNNPANPDCLCDSRGGGCELVSPDSTANNNVRTPNGHECKCGDKDLEMADNDTLAMALKLILDKVDTLEKGQEYIIKKTIG